jgi:DNA processing protein
MNTPASQAAETLADALRLSLVSGVGPRLRKALLDEFGTAGGVFAAAPADVRRVPGIGAELARRIFAARDEIDVQAQIELCAAHGIRILSDHDDDYPRALREIHDPPAILFVRGTILPQDALAVAMVGSRHATHYGIAQAERLAGSLARAGLTITSGLARGIDAAAHRGALAAGGRTIAVLGSGLLNIYPPEHAELAEQVVAAGAVVSEVPPPSPPVAGAFPQRNRIITGISLGVLVVEASTHSGALISARHAMEQGRDVFAVPGPIDSRMSRGCHRLIRDGAKLVETAEDVLEELGPLVAPAQSAAGLEVHQPAELLLNEIEQQVLSVISPSTTSIDTIVAESGLPAAQVLSTLSVLEMRHLVRRTSGTSVVRR